MTNHFELTTHFCQRPQQFAWFLGAGTSAVAGLPTAADIIWELKRRFYCREESQELSRQDVQIEAVRDRIQSYMLSKGFPVEGDPTEYTTYFKKIFGDDKEKQRGYIAKALAEDNVTLSAGNRVLAGLMATSKCRAVFTTNFDTVIERAVAEVSGRSLSAYHLEGAASALNALNAEEYPLYCKMHGDFRYDSLKNLKSDLARQNEDLSKCLIAAANKFGFIVSGYSGRDKSVVDLFHAALSTPNPFPHGLFWTVMKNSPVLPSVQELIERANKTGVIASLVEIETFDAFMLRLWRNLEDKEPAVASKVMKSEKVSVNIPLPAAGSGEIVRLNALQLTRLPSQCQSLQFTRQKEWDDLRAATTNAQGKLIFTKVDSVLCWGREALVRNAFPDVTSISEYDLTGMLAEIDRYQNIKGFLEDALCQALIRDRPLLTRRRRESSFIIADAHAEDQSALQRLRSLTGRTTGEITGLFAPVDEFHPQPEKMFWAEAVRVSIERVNDKTWLLLDPDVWIWPPRARREAEEFLDERRGNRFNPKYNALIDAWLTALLPSGGEEAVLSAFCGGSEAETPSFGIGVRSAFSRRIPL